jgi:hypothetical protein
MNACENNRLTGLSPYLTVPLTDTRIPHAPCEFMVANSKILSKPSQLTGLFHWSNHYLVLGDNQNSGLHVKYLADCSESRYIAKFLGMHCLAYQQQTH